jgi:tetratricopeptide (TPR) repeat protein
LVLTAIFLAAFLTLSDQPVAGQSASTPTAADALISYAEWLGARSGSVPVRSMDLDDARGALDQLASSYLMPVEGKVQRLRGGCPALSFTVSGTEFSTGTATEYEQLGCDELADGVAVRVVRQARRSLPVVRISRGSRSKPSQREAIPDEPQRRVLSAFALELAQAGADRQSAAAARLVEWACPLVRSHTPVNDFDRAWHRAALSLLEGAVDGRQLAAHVEHSQPTVGDDPRMQLATAVADEQLIAPREIIGPASDTELRRLGLATTDGERLRVGDRAIESFTLATTVGDVRAEARLRLGHVQWQLGRFDDSLASWAGIEQLTEDRALIYLVHLFRGLSLEGLGRWDEAKHAYAAALVVSPGAHSAVIRIGALEFLHGDRAAANRWLGPLLRDDDPGRDPWWSYYAADWRFWYQAIDALRAQVR